MSREFVIDTIDSSFSQFSFIILALCKQSGATDKGERDGLYIMQGIPGIQSGVHIPPLRSSPCLQSSASS